MTSWQTPANDHSQAGRVLLGRWRDDGLRVIWETLGHAGMGQVAARDLPDEAPNGSCGWEERAAILRSWVSLRSPYLPLPESYEAVEKALDGKFRQNLRRGSAGSRAGRSE